MKKLIFRKLYIDILMFFLTCILIVGVIVWTIQAVNYFDFVTEEGHGLKIYFYYSILNFPKILERIFVYIFLISILYTILDYDSKNEIFIFWVNGISKTQFLNKILQFSIIFMILQIILSSYIAPMSKLKARNYLKNSNMDFFTSLIQEGKFINITKGLTIFIEKKDKNGNLKNIFLEDNNLGFSRMIYSAYGELIDNNSQKSLKLYDGKVLNIEKEKINIFDFDEINFSLQNLSSKTITVPKIQEIDTKILLSCFFDISNDKFELFDCNKSLIREVKIELIKRIFKPIYIPLIALFSCFLIFISKNDVNYKAKKNYLFLTTFLILILSEVFVQYSFQSKIVTYICFSFPIVIFVICYYFFNKIGKNV